MKIKQPNNDKHIDVLNRILDVQQQVAELKQILGDLLGDMHDKPDTDAVFHNTTYQIMAYNRRTSPAWRVCITQNLIIDMTKRNVQKISNLYRQHEDDIQSHNDLMGVSSKTNRQLVSDIHRNTPHQTVAEWLSERIR